MFQSRSVRLDVAPRDRPFDLLVQRSLLELFESYGVAAAPKPITTQELPELPDLAGMARFTANGVRAAILVSMPRAVLARTARERIGDASLADWLRELTHQLMGRLKNRLIRYQVVCREEPATASVRAALDREFLPLKGRERVYAFRTLTGDVVVRVRGDIDESTLCFSSTAEMLGEGEIILF